jgi:hypothetical protein
MVLTRVTLHIKIGRRKVKTCWFGTIFAQFAEAGEKAQQSLTLSREEWGGRQQRIVDMLKNIHCSVF